MTDQPRLETATLGGGCFWCLEAAFTRLRGVLGVASGYMGGHVDQPSYEQVCGGDTDHAEVVRVAFDPDQISYGQLLEVFFVIHDPTTPDRQGNDVGSQYRSAIFCHDPEQERAARDMVAWLETERVFDAPIVTRIEPASTFWPAEDYHQDYFARHPAQPYCMFVVAPKVAKLRARFAALLRPGA
jgi:peptide-methionine (S)-S-oxide reductase